MFRFRDRIAANAEELAALVTREHGKTLAEARASVQRGIEVVEFACGVPSLIMGQSLANLARQVDCETVRHPVGVCAGITPFNFPAMVPLWMFPIAITCGNTFVLKPSEKVPMSAVRLGELLMESGLPEGVFNIVHGDREAVDALLMHPLVRAVSFVGSTTVARHVYETGTRNGKRVQAAGGAKNHLIVMPDADLDQAVGALQLSAFGCAGERCMAGSVAMPVGPVADDLVERLYRGASRLKVGPTDGGADVDMGPVITREHLDRVAGYIDVGRREGADVVLDGRSAIPEKDGGFLIGPSVLDRVQPDMRVARGDLRAGPLGHPRRRPRRGAGHRPRLPLWQRRLDLHPQRMGGPAVQAAFQRGDDRHQRRRPRPDGLVPVHRLERLVLRRPAHPGHRVDPVLYPAEDDHDPMVRVAPRLAPRPRLDDGEGMTIGPPPTGGGPSAIGSTRLLRDRCRKVHRTPGAAGAAAAMHLRSSPAWSLRHSTPTR